MGSGLLLLLSLASFACAKNVSSTITLGPENQWKYITKFALDIGKGKWEMKAKLLKSVDESSDTLNLDVLVYLDDNWEDTIYMDKCEDKNSLARREKTLRIPKNGEWSPDLSGTLSQRSKPHFWYFAVADCKGAFESKQRIKIELTITNSDGSQFSLEERGLINFYILVLVVFLVTLWGNLTRLIRKFKKTEDLETSLVILNLAVGCNFSSIVLEVIHLIVYAYNGRGLVVLDFFSQALEVISSLIVTIMFLLMSSGWSLKYKELPDADTWVPVGLLVMLLHLLIVGLGRITDDAYYKFSDYEGVPGALIVILRICMWGWFVFSIQKVLASTHGQLAGFVVHFSIVVSMYFLSVPGLVLFSWLFVTYWRHTVITIGGLLIQTGVFFLLSFLFSERSTYYKVSTMSSSVLPGKIQ
jgi:hypothetical protein